MCGICGIATTRGAADVEALRAMSDLLVHRGPDSAGEHLANNVALAARRLSIIDLAPTVLKYFGVPIPSDIDGKPIF